MGKQFRALQTKLAHERATSMVDSTATSHAIVLNLSQMVNFSAVPQWLEPKRQINKIL